MSLQRFDTPLELKFVAETGVFEGYASVFGVTDSVNDKIAPGAFVKSLGEYRSRGSLPPLLWQHDARQPIGIWREMHEDSHGLFVRGELFVDDISQAQAADRLLREKAVTGLSIGYRVRESYRDEKTGTRVLTDIELMEVSIVTFPANDRARITAVKSAFDGGDIPSEREFEAFLREAGMSRKQAKGFISQGYKALSAREAAEDDDDITSAIESLAEKIRAAADC
jgi:uncharacterized protein